MVVASRILSKSRLRTAIADVWKSVIQEDGYFRSARLSVPGPGGQWPDQVYIIPTLRCAFHQREHDRGTTDLFVMVGLTKDQMSGPISKTVLTPDFEFNLPTETFANETFSRIIETGASMKLAHVGQLGGGRRAVGRGEFRRRAVAHGWHPVDVGNENLFIISDVTTGRVAADMAAYGALCRAIRTNDPSVEIELVPNPDASTTRAISAGPFKGGVRSSVVFEAKHSPIVAELEALLDARGWKVSSAQVNSRADLVCERNARKVLFEVKSDADVHSLICAAGQCMIYGQEHRPHRKIVVALDTHDRASEWITERLRALGIELVLASKDGNGRFIFAFLPDDELSRDIA